jgi:hypothetical protein
LMGVALTSDLKIFKAPRHLPRAYPGNALEHPFYELEHGSRTSSDSHTFRSGPECSSHATRLKPTGAIAQVCTRLCK